MARRSKIELYDLLNDVVRMYEQEHMTIRDIEARLRDDGYDVSRGCIHRSLKSYREVARQYSQSLDEAKLLIDTVKDNPNTDVLETTTSLLAHRLFEFAKGLDAVDFDDPVKFADVVAKMARAQVSMGRLRMEFEKGFEQARETILSEIGKALGDDPELLSSVMAKIEKVKPRG
jgi:hypothetical protein